jgi:hypothetical protein
LTANEPAEFATVSDLALIYTSDSGPSFPSVNALITSLDQITGELVAVSHETGAAERDDTLSSPLYGPPP